MRYTYILQCADHTYYTGITNDLTKRLYDHNNSKTGAKYTKSRRPVTLAGYQSMDDKIAAMQLERKLKHISRSHKEQRIVDHAHHPSRSKKFKPPKR